MNFIEKEKKISGVIFCSRSIIAMGSIALLKKMLNSKSLCNLINESSYSLHLPSPQPPKKKTKNIDRDVSNKDKTSFLNKCLIKDVLKKSKLKFSSF